MKLKSGREVELRELTFLEKAPIKDMFYSAAFYHGTDTVPLYSLALKCLMQIGFKEQELSEWKDEEIMEAGNWVLENSQITEVQKKS